MTDQRLRQLDWEKGGGLLPAIVQDARNGRVLMLGYMNAEALERTLHERRVTFYSRTRNALWTKGETSGNYLELVQVVGDCDDDSLLVLANPSGPTCHNGTVTCFAGARDPDATGMAFLGELEGIVADRIASNDPNSSYTARLVEKGIGRIAQKVGEEGVETALAAVTRDDAGLVGECADLLFHLLVLLKARGLPLASVIDELQSRHAARS
jgi:phosphoribosyl-ATP pyrophosphohydrolase/phosphoribosyl-AMP cyclohydrolase